MAGYVAELHHDVRVERRHRDGDDRDDGSDGHGARRAQRLRQRQRRPRKRAAAAAKEAHELLGRGRGGLSAQWQNAEETDLTIRSHRA